jgi:hypothetical protein
MHFYIAYNQSADKNPPHPPTIVESVLHVKGDTDCCGFALIFRGLASGELKINKLPTRLPMNVFNLKEKTMKNW